MIQIEEIDSSLSPRQSQQFRKLLKKYKGSRRHRIVNHFMLLSLRNAHVEEVDADSAKDTKVWSSRWVRELSR